jgi:hypothetical protein
MNGSTIDDDRRPVRHPSSITHTRNIPIRHRRHSRPCFDLSPSFTHLLESFDSEEEGGEEEQRQQQSHHSLVGMRPYTISSTSTGGLFIFFSVLSSWWWGRVESFDVSARPCATTRSNRHHHQWELEAVETPTDDTDYTETLRTEQRHLRFAGVGR